MEQRYDYLIGDKLYSEIKKIPLIDLPTTLIEVQGLIGNHNYNIILYEGEIKTTTIKIEDEYYQTQEFIIKEKKFI